MPPSESQRRSIGSDGDRITVATEVARTHARTHPHQHNLHVRPGKARWIWKGSARPHAKKKEYFWIETPSHSFSQRGQIPLVASQVTRQPDSAAEIRAVAAQSKDSRQKFIHIILFVSESTQQPARSHNPPSLSLSGSLSRALAKGGKQSLSQHYSCYSVIALAAASLF